MYFKQKAMMKILVIYFRSGNNFEEFAMKIQFAC